MQFNFLVYPAPKKYSIDVVYKKIYLIPRNQQEQHIKYEKYAGLGESSDNLNIFFKNYEKKSLKNLNKNVAKIRMFGSIQIQEPQLIKPSSRSSFEKQNIRRTQIIKIQPKDYIPCSFYQGRNDKLIIFYHANGQDITSCDIFMRCVNQQTGYNILVLQYQNYSIYKGQANTENIQIDSERLLQYVISKGIPKNKINLFGRSIGASIAFITAAKFHINSLSLLSPFLSLAKIVQHLYGNCGSLIIKQSLNNEEIAKNINCPILLVHGLQDTLVPYDHSLALFSYTKTYCRLKLIPEMTHSKFHFKNDFICHLVSFLSQIN